jgi:acyl-coenzyme A thioesterase PaaI-like protein
MTAFDEAIAAKQIGEGRYEVRPDERFAIISAEGKRIGGVNGGVLLASVLRAVLDTSPHPHPVATSAHYLRVPRTEPAVVTVTWLKQGRTAATARATLSQDGVPMLETTVTTGSVPEGGDGESGLSWTGQPPVLPPPAQCTALAQAAGRSIFAGFAAQVDLRLDPATSGWLHGRPAGLPEMRGYFRLAEDRDPDACLLALAVDALPPVVFGIAPAAWSPTVELTWHMRAVPAPGLLRVAARGRHVGGGWFDEETEVWDAAGRLVAQSRQLARVGRAG